MSDKLTPVPGPERSRIRLSDGERSALAKVIRATLEGEQITGRVEIEYDFNQGVVCDAFLIQKRKAQN